MFGPKIPVDRAASQRQHSGFSLLEMMTAMALLLTVSAIVMTSMMQTTRTQGTIDNRTEMHAGVRSATELLQQEIGQAGRITLPGIATLSSAVAGGAVASPTVSSTCTTCTNPTDTMYVGQQLIVDQNGVDTNTTSCPTAPANPCPLKETVTVTAVSATGFTAFFNNKHASGVAAVPLGGFANGIVPTNTDATNCPSTGCAILAWNGTDENDPTTTFTGSDGNTLKLFGDINGDGKMVYIEYHCDWAGVVNASVGPALYRNVMSYSAISKPALTAAMALLPNLYPNGNPVTGKTCFNYQQKTSGGTTYVVDVSVTLTVQTPNPDPVTNLYQQETKALLNVSPRNVFETWQLSGLDYLGRVQPVPAWASNLF